MFKYEPKKGLGFLEKNIAGVMYMVRSKVILQVEDSSITEIFRNLGMANPISIKSYILMIFNVYIGYYFFITEIVRLIS